MKENLMLKFEKMLSDSLWNDSYVNTLKQSLNYENQLLEPNTIYQVNATKSLYPTCDHQIIEVNDFTYTNKLDEFIKVATECPIYVPHFKTLLIYDLSPYVETEYKTLIFELHSKPLKTMESSNTIMKRFSHNHPAIFTYNKFVAKQFDYVQRVPLIMGEQIFVPSAGYSKKPASWIALHLIASIEHSKKENLTYLYGLFNSQIIVPYSNNFTPAYLERVCNLYWAQKTMALNIIEPFHHTLSLHQKNEYRNVIYKMISERNFSRSSVDFNDYLAFFIHNEAQRVLTKITGCNNPYLDDIIAYFENIK